MNTNEIISAIETNLLDFYSTLNNNKTQLIFNKSNYFYTENAVFSWPQFLFREDNLKPINKLDLELLKKWYFENKTSKFIFNNQNICKIENFLKENNFLPVAKWIGMYLKLENHLNINYNENYFVEKVKTEIELKKWFDIVNTEILKNNNLKFDIFKKHLSDENFHFLIGKISGIPVSTALIFTNHNFTGLYFISTLESYRNKGFGGQITKTAINKALENGFKNILLHSTKKGEKIYKKLGFYEYSKIYLFTIIK
jgi:ribosomal protein S18 acetylase RimI-like enzyme